MTDTNEPTPTVETTPNVREIVRQYLEQNGYDGLVSHHGCECGGNYLLGCGNYCLECRPAIGLPATDENIEKYNCPDVDIIYVPAVWDRELAIRQLVEEIGLRDINYPSPMFSHREFFEWLIRIQQTYALYNVKLSMPPQKYGIREA